MSFLKNEFVDFSKDVDDESEYVDDELNNNQFLSEDVDFIVINGLPRSLSSLEYVSGYSDDAIKRAVLRQSTPEFKDNYPKAYAALQKYYMFYPKAPDEVKFIVVNDKLLDVQTRVYSGEEKNENIESIKEYQSTSKFKYEQPEAYALLQEYKKKHQPSYTSLFEKNQEESLEFFKDFQAKLKVRQDDFQAKLKINQDELFKKFQEESFEHFKKFQEESVEHFKKFQEESVEQDSKHSKKYIKYKNKYLQYKKQNKSKLL